MYDQLFQLSNLLVMPFWLLMIGLPFWRWTKRIIRSPWIVAPAAVLYAALVLPQLLGLLAELANPQLAQIAALLGTPAGATIGGYTFWPLTCLSDGGSILIAVNATAVPGWFRRFCLLC